MRHCLLLATLWLLAGAAPALGQKPKFPLPLDSLLAGLQRPGLPDTLRVQYLMELCGRLQATDLPAAKSYGARSVALARRIGYPRGEAKALSNLAGVHYYAGDYVAAQQAFEALLALGRRVDGPPGTVYLGHAYLGLGNVAQALGNLPRALAHFAQAGAAYAAAQPPNLNGQILVLSNTANAYNELKQPTRAAQALRRALALTGPTTEARLTVTVLAELGGLQVEAQHPDSAQRTLARGLALALAGHNLRGEARIRGGRAQAALAQRRPALAEAEARQALALNREVGDADAEVENLLTLATVLHALRRPEAYDTLQRYVALHDTLLAQDRSDAIIEAQTRYDLAGEQAKLKIGTQQRELQRLRYQRQLFGLAGLLLLLALLAGGGAWWYRRRQARRETALRSRLAADLHDDVGTLLSQISLQSGLLQEGLADPGAQRQQLHQITEASRSAVRQLNDVVWSLDAHNDDLLHLVDRMRDYAYEVLEPLGIGVQVEVPEQLPARPLPILLRRNLYLIYKESLHNILKHAQGASEVSVRVALHGAELQLDILDNAPALALATGRPARRSGHGLRNITERAVAVGGEARCAPLEDGPGFAVRVRVPLGG